MIGILTDPQTGDLQIKAGTLLLGDTTAQVAESVLRASRGEFKEHPLLGAEALRLTNGTPSLMWCAEAKTMLQACGVPATEVKMEDNRITIQG